MNPIDRLKNASPNLTRSEQIIADYIINNPLAVIRLSLTEVAKRSKSSNTAIIRLCQKLGYQGFAEFKFSLSRAALSDASEYTPDSRHSCANNAGSFPGTDSNAAVSIISQYVSILNEMATGLDLTQIQKIARLCYSANHLAIMGYNRTGFSASQLSYRLSKLGLPNYLITDFVVMKDYMEILGQGDVTIIFSISTSNISYQEISRRIKKNGGKVILFTMNTDSPIRRYCSQVVVLPQISYRHKMSFLDDQTIFFVFIEVLLSQIAAAMNYDPDIQ